MTPIHLADPAHVHQRTAADAERAIQAVLRGGRWVGGAATDAALDALAQGLGRTHGIGASSGTRALARALQVVGVKPGHRVIVPAVSFVSTATAVLHIGAIPVVADVTPGVPLLDPSAVEAILTADVEHTVTAVVPVLLFGHAAPRLTVPEGVSIVDDAAQAYGRRGPVGQGAVQAVSFYPTKVLPAAGDGGLLATDDPTLAQRARSLGFHGRTPDGRFCDVDGHVPGNDRLDSLQAALLVARLSDVAPRVARRQQIHARYARALPDAVLPLDPTGNSSVVAMLHPDRDRLRADLLQHGIHTGCYYPRPLHQEPVLQGRCEVPAPTPHADAFCRHTLALPVHVGLSDVQVDTVIAAIEAHR